MFSSGNVKETQLVSLEVDGWVPIECTFKKAWFAVMGWIYQVQLRAVVSTVMKLWVP
jgi:hypothetical protein